MNDNLKENEETWSVEPPKRDHRRLKTALRIALIVAALGAAALVGAAWIVGNSIRKQFPPYVGGEIIQNPHKEVVETGNIHMDCRDAEDFGQSISGAEYGAE